MQQPVHNKTEASEIKNTGNMDEMSTQICPSEVQKHYLDLFVFVCICVIQNVDTYRHMCMLYSSGGERSNVIHSAHAD